MPRKSQFKIVTHDRKSLFAQGKYCNFYNKDFIVHAVPGTLGLMTFRTRREAKDFRNELWSADKNRSKIIRVLPTSRGHKLYQICKSQTEGSLNHYYEGNREIEPYPLYAPEGTMGYRALKVLD